MKNPKTLLVIALVAVVGMAFRVSWNALRDIAETVGADPTASLLYPFVVDGLMALALVATLALTGRDRDFALRVLAGYTLASLVLNYVHGLAPGERRLALAQWGPANWLLVLLATSLPVGSIFFGSDLVAKVLHHRPQTVRDDAHTAASSSRAAVDGEETRRTGRRTHAVPYAASGQVSPRTPRPEKGLSASSVRPRDKGVRRTGSKAYDEAEMERTRQRAEQTYADSLDAGSPIGPAALGREFGFSEGWGRKRIKAVEARRAHAGDRAALVPAGAAAQQ